jgi:class 3 adenylate cyclase/SAM-dependent methyltransferase
MGMIRTATVMFTDLVASTARAARLGPVRADALRLEHFELVRRVLDEHGGAEVKTLGDGIMAVFDSVAGAVDAGIALQQTLEAANRTNPDAPELRVGLSVGEVRQDGLDFFGAAVIEAARLCAEAKPRQVLCTSVVRTLAQDHCAHGFQSAGRRTLKGLPGPMAVEEVTWTPLVEPGLFADFAHLDRGGSDRAVACSDLQQGAPFFAEVRQRILGLLAPRPCQVLLDVGSGAGQDVFELARLVGPAGKVIGVDKSAEMVAEASRRAAAAEVGDVEFRVGDAERLPLDNNSVDGACSDRVFQYLADPPVAVGELMRVTRPGGWVVVADTDWGASMFDCDDLELTARIDDAWTATRASGRIGRRLFGLFVRAGFHHVQVFPHNVAVTDISDGGPSPAVASMYRDQIIAGLAAQALEAGAVTAEEASRWVALQNAAVRDGRFFRFLAMFVVAGQVPDDTGSATER